MISGRDEIFTKNIEEPWLYCYDILYLDYLYCRHWNHENEEPQDQGMLPKIVKTL